MRNMALLLATTFIYSISGASVQEQNTSKENGDSSSTIPQQINNVRIGGIDPNPFCVNTFLSFTVEKDDTIKVELFDILGTPKGMIINSFFNSGSNSIGLDEKDLKSGIYFIKFSTPDTSIFERVVFLK